MRGTVDWATNRARDSRFQFATAAGVIAAVVAILPDPSTIAALGVPILEVRAGTVIFTAGAAVGYVYTDGPADRRPAVRWGGALAGVGGFVLVIRTFATELVPGGTVTDVITTVAVAELFQFPDLLFFTVWLAVGLVVSSLSAFLFYIWFYFGGSVGAWIAESW